MQTKGTDMHTYGIFTQTASLGNIKVDLSF